MVLSLIYHVIKKIFKTVIDIVAWLLVALSLWIPLVYTVIFVVWCGIAGKSLSALSTIYWAGLAITFIGSFFVSAFLFERKQKRVSKQSVKSTPDNAESVKYKRDTAELKKRSTVSDEDFEEEREPSNVFSHKKVNAEYIDSDEEEENRLKRHIREERDRVHKQEELSDAKARLSKEDLFAAKAAEAERREGSLGHRPQDSYTNSYNQPQNPYGFTPYNNGQNAQNQYNQSAYNPQNPQNPYGFTPYNDGQNTPPPPFINPYKPNNNNPLSQANNPYNQQNYGQGNNQNYGQSYQQNHGQQDFGFAPYNANPYANQQNNFSVPKQNYNNSAANPYGFEQYDANPYKLKSQPDLNSAADNSLDSFYNQGESYKVFDRELTDEIRLNTQRQESETPKIFATKNDPTIFIHEYSDRLEYFKRTRQGMVFMKAVNK